MKVGVYNRWLHTMGGGERHSCMAAATLAVDHEVTLITHRALDRDELASRLDVDLARVGLKVVPAMPPNRFVEFTREYDLFINASFMTGQPSGARRSMLLVLFPSPVDRSFWARLRRKIGMTLMRELLLPEYIEGFYDVQELGRGWFRYATDQAVVRLHLPRGDRARQVDILCGNFRPADVGAINAVCSVDGRELGRVSLPPASGAYTRWPIILPPELARAPIVDLCIRSDVYNPDRDLGVDDNRNIGLAVTDVAIAHPRRLPYEILLRRVFPELGLRLEGLPYYGSLDFLDTYDLICPISEFSRHWMNHYWDRDGPILYPPVAVHTCRRGEKRPIILSVGRFFGAGGHSKRHHFMVKAFAKMVRRGLEGWELHLAGNRGFRPIDDEYFRSLELAARGLPVRLHPDLPFAELRDLYARSSIYWHASGHGENIAKNPVKFEHFGITTVEAMASGCVPVAINHGGQPEVVSDGLDGFLWNTEKELIERTFELAGDADLMERLATRGVESSRRFGEDGFRARLLELVATLDRK